MAKLAAQWWRENYLEHGGSRLSFLMINRLVEAAQRESAQLGRALRSTYPHVFVDEFQDTTYAQFDLLKSIFSRSDVNVTAVGDDKQRIMGWAGARQDAFSRFESEFTAHPFKLRLNYRSSESLVAIQQVVANSIELDSPQVESKASAKIEADSSQIWRFMTKRQEAEYVASWIQADMRERALSPADYAILVRQTAGKFEADLRTSLESRGLSIRNDNRLVGTIQLQDLLSSTICAILLPLFRLMTRPRDPASWTKTIEHLSHLRNPEIESFPHQRAISKELQEFLQLWQPRLASKSPSEERADLLLAGAVDFLDRLAIVRSYAEYQDAGYLDAILESASLHLKESCGDAVSWDQAFNNFEGLDSISLLTVHKSKGLEYDSVLLIGLDDRTWWSHKKGDAEGAATLFVALSRAKQRIMFTHCNARGGTGGISDLYALLHSAGVPEVVF
jgi:superfamily I DNA/RNA helicase